MTEGAPVWRFEALVDVRETPYVSIPSAVISRSRLSSACSERLPRCVATRLSRPSQNTRYAPMLLLKKLLSCGIKNAWVAGGTSGEASVSVATDFHHEFAQAVDGARRRR